MLRKGKVELLIALVLFLGLFHSCIDQSNTKENQYDTMKMSMSTIGEKEYWRIYNSIVDSIKSWDENDLDNFDFERTGKKMIIDSVLCFNSTKDKLISKLMNFNTKNTASDGIDEFYGAKIDGKWYFWTGGYTPVVRDAPGHAPNKPLSYEQLHSMVGYSGYLDQNGKIRDEWFEKKFKSGRFPFKDRYKYNWILDNQRIDNEKDYWNYSYWKSGTKLWADKLYLDTVSKKENANNKSLSHEEKNKIRIAISRLLMDSSKFKME